MSGKRNAGAVVDELEAALGPVRYPAAGAAPAEPDDAPTAKLPEFIAISDLITKAPKEPALLIGGTGEDGRRNALVHRGDKVLLGAESKAGKTWFLIQKALCIAAGIPFLGHKTTRGVVLYVNFELAPWAFAKRVKAVAEALGLLDGQGRWRDGLVPDLLVWNLRGVPGGYDIENLVTVAEERFKQMDIQLAAVALDPLYKSYGGRQENDAGDMAQVFEAIERFGHRLGAAIFIAAHFAKGDSAAKAQLDRISGSGVMARDPDSILTLSKFKDADNCFTFEATLRNMASPEPVVLEFAYPIWKLRSDLAATGKGYSLEDLANLLPTDPDAGLTGLAWFEAAGEQGICTKKARFQELKDHCLERGLVRFKNGPKNAQIFSRKL